MKINSRILAAVLAFAMVLSMFAWGDSPFTLTANAAWDGTVATSFSSGSGTETNPYIIETEAQMGYFRQLLSEGLTFEGLYLKLGANLDMTGGIWTSVNTEFCGDFNGNGYTLTVDTQFVGTVGEGGRVRYLTVKCPDTTDLPMICSYNKGTIEGCIAFGTVDDDEYYAGGLVYTNTGTMLNVAFVGSVGGKNMDVGGLVYKNSGTIKNAYCSATLEAYSSGKYGSSSEDATVRVNSGTVKNVYYNSANGDSSYGTGMTEAEMKAQTFVNALNQTNPSLITKWAVGATATEGFPVIVTDNKSDIVCTLSNTEADAFICNSGTVLTISKSSSKTCTIYYTTDGTNPTTSSTRVCYSTGFAVTKDTTINMVAYENGVYGVVRTQKAVVMAGKGTEAQPFEITTKAQLQALSISPAAHFELKNDLTFTDSDFAAGGIYPDGWQPVETFEGVLEGNGYAISNMQGVGGGFVETNSGTISGIRFINHQLTGRNATFGTIAHYNSGTITKCYINLDVTTLAPTSSAYVGGIAGYNSGTISYCQIEGDLVLTGPGYRYCWIYTGGISGSGTGTVKSCYSKLDMVINSRETTEYVYYGGIAYSGSSYDCRNDGTVYFNVSLDYDIYAYAFSTDRSYNCYGDLSYTTAGSLNVNRFSNPNYSGIWESYNASGRTAEEKMLESTFPALDFNEKWMILENGPVPQGIMNADGTCYTKTDYRQPACEDGYTSYVDQNGRTYTQTLPLNGIHLGGTATCVHTAVCELCGVSYGELDAHNHSGIELVTQQNDATYPFAYADGVYTSTNKTNNTSSVYTITANAPVTIGIEYTVSSEQNYDKLTILKNGTTISEYSGTKSGTSSVALAAEDTLQIRYKKDTSQSAGDDCITFKLTVPENKATCTEALICRDCGETVEVEKGHNFLDGVNDSSYPFQYSAADGTYTSTNKTTYSKSTYTFTAQRDVKVTINYSVSSKQSYHYLRIKKNSSTVKSDSGEVSGTATVTLAAGDKLYIQYDHDYSYSGVGEDCITFSLSQEPIAQCTEKVVCSDCNGVVKQAYGHTYVNHAAQAPTCTASGWAHYQTCENCDYTSFERLSATGHTYVNHEAKAATCTEIGWNAYKTCEKCSYTTYVEIPATGHSDGITYQNDSAYPFTCSDGKYTSTNKTASTSSTYTLTATVPVLVAITYEVSSEANYDKLSIVKNTTNILTQSGEKTDTVNVQLDAGDYLRITYSKDGSLDRGNDCASFMIESLPTCTEAVICTTCNAEIKPATGHTQQEEPTCTSAARCSVCNEIVQQPVPHTYINSICAVCGGEDIVDSGNCGETVTWRLLSNGKLFISGTGAMSSWESAGAPWYDLCASVCAVIIEDGVTTIGNYAFNDCTGLTYIALPDSVTAIGTGAFANCSQLTSITMGSSVTELGTAAFENCTSLNAVYFAASSTKWNGIAISDGNDCLKNTAINYYHIHDYTLFPTTVVEATCTEGGYTEYTCIYGDTYRGDFVAALGHNYEGGVNVISPTCLEAGYTILTCTRCNYTEETDPLTALDHDYSEVDTVVASTCTETGHTIMGCSRCDVTIQTNQTPALDHDYSVINTVIDPTCTDQGYTVKACSRCSVTMDTDHTPALGHDFTGEATVVEPTCQAQGYTIHSCVRCDETTIADYVEPGGHAMIIVQAVAVTCTTDGRTMGSCCKWCGMVGVASKVIPAAGHNFVEDVCDVCNYIRSVSLIDSEGNVLGDYVSIEEALNAATSGYTVTLLKDLTDTDLALCQGVSLDLNGYTLTVDSVLTFGQSAIVDSSAQNTGVLKVLADDGNMISASNKELPVYDAAAGGYRFFAVTVTSHAVTGKTKYWFKVEAENFEQFNALIQSGSEVIIKVKMTFGGQTEDVHAVADWAFAKDWAQKYNANKDVYIIVTVAEAKEIEQFTLTPCITSCGVEITGDEM